MNAIHKVIVDHKSDYNNPHKVTAEQTGAYTKEETDKAIDAKIVEIGSGDMSQAVYDPDHLNENLGVQLYTHTKSGTVHNFVGTGINGRAKITANYSSGDTFQLNGQSVIATCGSDSVDADTIVNGRWVSFIADAEGGQINFNGGGGLSNSKLSATNAATSNVLSGKTFYSGNKTKKTGTMKNNGSWHTSVNAGSKVSIPVGYHNGSGYVSSPSNFSAKSGNKEKNGGSVEIRRDEGNRTSSANTYMRISATVSGRKVTVSGYAHFHVSGGASGTLGQGDYSVCTINFELPF